VLSGSSPLIQAMNDAAIEHDVPAEILAGLAWAETGFRPARFELDDHGHGPRAIGVMALPEKGRVRSAERAASLLSTSVEALEADAENVRGAASILRAIADETFGEGALGSDGDRDRWLIVVERYLDAGAAGEAIALEVRKTIARGLDTTDADGRRFVIPSYADLYADRAPTGTASHGLNAEYPGATWVAADGGNYTNAARSGADIDVVVIHTTQGSYAGTISWFRNPSANVTAHYVVRRSDGAITQMVRHADVAWHAGNWSYNQRSIGIEHEGYVSDPNNYTTPMLEASAALTRWLCDNLGVPKDRSHIIGHVEVPGATHTDPGQYFPWSRYMDMVRNGTSPMPSGNGTLQGVVFIGTDTANRLPGATITLSPGGQTATARAGDGYWSFSIAPGTYTVTARASGYDTNSVTRTVGAGSQTWGSLGLTRTVTVQTGTLKGVVYDATKTDLNTRIAGATVRLSNGAQATSNETGFFEFEIAPGQYTITVSKQGWQDGTNQRTVAAGQLVWGSTGMIPANAPPMNRPPQVPSLESPIHDVTTRSPAPIFTVDEIRDPDGDAVTIEIELFSDKELQQRVSSGSVRATAQDRLISWRHPAQDLPRGARVYWRVRANDGRAQSPWSEAESFWAPADGSTASPEAQPWMTGILPGVGTNGAPSAPEVQDPTDDGSVMIVRPQIVAKPAVDPEGDTLAYQFQIASDDLFQTVESESALIEPGSPAPTWVVDRDLAPGQRFYVRVRAADERVYSAWSPAVSFTISPEAASGDDEKPTMGSDRGGAPQLSAKVLAEDGGCSTTGGRSGMEALALAGLALFLLRKRGK
jgi:hypothetical protein